MGVRVMCSVGAGVKRARKSPVQARLPERGSIYSKVKDVESSTRPVTTATATAAARAGEAAASEAAAHRRRVAAAKATGGAAAEAGAARAAAKA